MSKKQLFRKTFWGMVGFMVITLLAFFGATIGWAQTQVPYKLPRVIYIASGDVGSFHYGFAATMAEKIAPVLGCKFRMIPGSDVERINMLRSGKAHFGSLAADLYWASMGLGQYSAFAFGPQPPRIVWSGWPGAAASTGIATAASGIKTPYDLKGKRLAQVVGAAYHIEATRAILAFAKLTSDDVKIVDVSTIGAAYKSLAEGRADFTTGASNAPGVYEIEASPYGVYLVRYPHEDKEGWARYNKFMPYQTLSYTTVGVGVKPGEKVPTPQYPFPVWATMESQSDELVYAICKAIYSKMDEIVTAFPGNEALRPERGIIPGATTMVPFHHGAVKFFKEIGVWTAELEAANNKKLAHLDRVNKRWSAYFEEAHERMAKTGKKVDPSNEWREIVEKEVGLLP